jgi:hypothetical protein
MAIWESPTVTNPNLNTTLTNSDLLRNATFNNIGALLSQAGFDANTIYKIKGKWLQQYQGYLTNGASDQQAAQLANADMTSLIKQGKFANTPTNTVIPPSTIITDPATLIQTYGNVPTPESQGYAYNAATGTWVNTTNPERTLAASEAPFWSTTGAPTTTYNPNDPMYSGTPVITPTIPSGPGTITDPNDPMYSGATGGGIDTGDWREVPYTITDQPFWQHITANWTPGTPGGGSGLVNGNMRQWQGSPYIPTPSAQDYYRSMSENDRLTYQSASMGSGENWDDRFKRMQKLWPSWATPSRFSYTPWGYNK